MNTHEPPFVIPTTTSGQPTMKTSIDTSARANSTIKVMMIEHKIRISKEREPTKEQIGQMDTSIHIAQIQGAPP